jgi:hypothetical protein
MPDSSRPPSVSQFSREYSRFFGQPPMRDIKTLRPTSPPDSSDAWPVFAQVPGKV